MDIDITSVLTTESFVKLKCSICKNYLSHFPTYISAEKENICGRCYGAAQANLVENKVYETVAQFIKFPCRYKREGCTLEALPKEIPAHEENCEHITMKCRTSDFTACNWEGTYSDMQNHCLDEHADLILENGDFELDLSQSIERKNLILHAPTLFFVYKKFDSISKLMEFATYSFRPESNNQQLSCEVTLKIGNRQVVVEFNTTGFDDTKVTEVFLDSLKHPDNTSSVVMGKIKLGKTDDHDMVLMKELKIDEELLSLFKCSMCEGYTLPPIYEQHTHPNEIRCSDCKSGKQVHSHPYKRSNTPVSKFSASQNEHQNYNLDKVANLLNYPCKYYKNGCTFISKPPDMANHQAFCIYGSYACPLGSYINCQWYGPGKDLTKHIEESHQTLIVDSNEEISEPFFVSKTADPDFRPPISTVASISNYVPVSSGCSFSTANSHPPFGCVVSQPFFVSNIADPNFRPPISTVASISNPVPVSSGCSFSTANSHPLFGCVAPAPVCTTASFKSTTRFDANSGFGFLSTISSNSVPVTTVASLQCGTNRPNTVSNVGFNFVTSSSTVSVSTTPHFKFTSSANPIPTTAAFGFQSVSSSKVATVSGGSSSDLCFCKSHIIKLSDHFFLVNFVRKDGIYHWFVQMIGMVSCEFMFELEIIDKVNQHSGLISRQPCIYLKKKEELLLFTSCFFHKDQVANLVSNGSITFKVQVYRKL